jgi:hypothetical protein
MLSEKLEQYKDSMLEHNKNDCSDRPDIFIVID